jgi:hypothetical protein
MFGRLRTDVVFEGPDAHATMTMARSLLFALFGLCSFAKYFYSLLLHLPPATRSKSTPEGRSEAHMNNRPLLEHEELRVV